MNCSIIISSKHDYADSLDHIWDEVIVEYEGSLVKARNRGAERATGDIYVFIDDDVYVDSTWHDALLECYEKHNAIAAGGPAYPDWPDSRPWYLPREWDWLVGCGPYHDEICEIRNTYGCNISFRADIFDGLGGFNENYGKGSDLGQREEAELCARMQEEYGQGLTYHPEMDVYHRVDPEQLRYMDLLIRAHEFGLALSHDGHDDTERSYLANAIKDPRGWPFIAAIGAGYL